MPLVRNNRSWGSRYSGPKWRTPQISKCFPCSATTTAEEQHKAAPCKAPCVNKDRCLGITIVRAVSLARRQQRSSTKRICSKLSAKSPRKFSQVLASSPKESASSRKVLASSPKLPESLGPLQASCCLSIDKKKGTPKRTTGVKKKPVRGVGLL